MLQYQQLGYIRHSTDGDLKEILNWLKNHGNFYGNRRLICEAHLKKNLVVYIDLITAKPVAYLWCENFDPQILDVRIEKQKQGIGRQLVEYCIQQAIKNDHTFLEIECSPETSIPFWKKMGFQIYTRNIYDFSSPRYAYKFLEMTHTLPKDGMFVELKISFYPAEKKWQHDIRPISSFSPKAILSKNTIYLPNRIHGFCTKSSYDLVVEISINQKEIYLDKARYSEAIGVRYMGNAFCIDKVSIAL